MFSGGFEGKFWLQNTATYIPDYRRAASEWEIGFFNWAHSGQW